MKSPISSLSPADLRAVAELVVSMLKSSELAHALDACTELSKSGTPVRNLSIDEACERIGYKSSWLYAQQRIPGSLAPRIRKAGRRSVVRSDDVERFIMECPQLHEIPAITNNSAEAT